MLTIRIHYSREYCHNDLWEKIMYTVRKVTSRIFIDTCMLVSLVNKDLLNIFKETSTSIVLWNYFRLYFLYCHELIFICGYHTMYFISIHLSTPVTLWSFLLYWTIHPSLRDMSNPRQNPAHTTNINFEVYLILQSKHFPAQSKVVPRSAEYIESVH